MKKKIEFLLILFLVSQIIAIKANVSLTRKLFKSAMHWVLSAGPQFADAIYNVALLSDDYAYEIYGSDDADYFTQSFVRRVLEECGIDNSEIIQVKIIKHEAQKYIVSAITCTQTTIFINSSIFDYLGKSDQKNLIAQAAVSMKRKYIEKNAIALGMIPIITYFSTEAYAIFCDYLFFQLPDHIKTNHWAKQIKKINKYMARFWATKLAINSLLAALYFKYQNRETKKFIAHLKN